MKSQTLLVLFLALICGGSAAIGVSQLVNRGGSGTTEATQIVVAAVDVPLGTLLNEQYLRLSDWPAGAVPHGAMTSIEEVVERTALTSLVKGEPILTGKLASKDAGRGLAAIIPSGMRAFSIETPHVAAGVGGFIMPNNRVDILLTTHGRHDDGTGGGATTTLLQNIKILAVDQEMTAPEGTHKDPKKLKSVTVLVTPDQAAKLDLGMNHGTLHLSLRNPEDHNEAETRPATLADLRFRQESPETQGTGFVSQAFGAVAMALAARGGSEAEAVEEGQEEVQSASSREQGQIRTLRGSHRGFVRVER